MRQEIPNSGQIGGAWTLVELIDALKKLMLHFFPLLSLSPLVQYLMKYTLHKLTALLTTISATSIKHKEWDPFLYYLFKKSTQLCPYEMGNILIFANNFLGFIAINWHNFDLSFNKLTSQQTYLGTYYSIRFDPSAMQKNSRGHQRNLTTESSKIHSYTIKSRWGWDQERVEILSLVIETYKMGFELTIVVVEGEIVHILLKQYSS